MKKRAQPKQPHDMTDDELLTYVATKESTALEKVLAIRLLAQMMAVQEVRNALSRL